MKASDYIIHIAGLKAGKHLFELSADATLFEELNPDLLEDAQLNVQLELQKSESMIEVNLLISGTISLTCDRSLKVFEEDFHTEERVFYKFGEEAKELSDDVMVIPFQQQEIDFLQLVYEFISLSLPMKRLHPDYRDEDDDDVWFYTAGEEEAEEASTEEEGNVVDPRWEALKRLKSDE